MKTKLNRRLFLGGLAAAGMVRAADKLKSLPTVHENIRQATTAAPLKMLFRGESPEDLAMWQSQLRGRVAELLGPHTPPAQWERERLSMEVFPEFTREEFLLKAKGMASLPVYTLRPNPKRFGKGPFAVVLCLHGHGEFGHDAVVGIDHTPQRVENIRKAN